MSRGAAWWKLGGSLICGVKEKKRSTEFTPKATCVNRAGGFLLCGGADAQKRSAPSQDTHKSPHMHELYFALTQELDDIRVFVQVIVFTDQMGSLP